MTLKNTNQEEKKKIMINEGLKLPSREARLDYTNRSHGIRSQLQIFRLGLCQSFPQSLQKYNANAR